MPSLGGRSGRQTGGAGPDGNVGRVAAEASSYRQPPPTTDGAGLLSRHVGESEPRQTAKSDARAKRNPSYRPANREVGCPAKGKSFLRGCPANREAGC